MSDELGGLSTSLGLSASPPPILWTESVVVMEWKGMSTSIAAPIGKGRTKQDARRKRETGTARAHELASNWGDTLTHTLVVEPYSSDQVQTGALQAVLYSVNRGMCSLASRPTAR